MSLTDYSARTITGQTQALDAYRDQVCLVVNVASACGYTPQYAELEALYRRHQARGFVVLGFPCDQFGHQEPGSEAQIQEFCRTTYDVTFPMFAKIEVNGPDTHPLYRYLKSEQTGLLGTDAIKWNFTKFLVNRSGHPVRRFAPGDTVSRIEPEVIRVL